jgi:RND family efflux transporter MFP subunit
MVVPSGTSQLQHEYAAEVRARLESRLAFRVGGKLTKRMVEVGDTVRTGQPLAQLDPQDLQLGQDNARAALAAATANLDIQEAEFKRYKELREQGFISSLELERREATLKSARAQADQARSQAAVQRNQAQYALLVSDASGVVTGVDAEPGAVVAAGTPILRVARDGPRDVVFSVPEDRADAARAWLGRRGAIKVRFTGTDAVTVPATVREIAAAADPVTRTFLIKADLGEASVRLGQTATAVVDEPAIAGVVKLPLASVFEQQGQSAVWILDPAAMTVAPKTVTIAGAEGNMVVVASGVEPGQTVVTAGVHTLSPGQKVSRYIETPVGGAEPARKTSGHGGPAASSVPTAR